MNWETFFQVANLLAIAGWVILILAPRRWRAAQLVPAYVLPAALGAAYFMLVAVYFAGAEGGYSTLAAVGRLFESEPIRLAGWLHYLAFDLFIGAWIARRSDERGLSRVIQAPILAVTFLFGPVGLLIFMLYQLGTGAPRVPVGGTR